jgi:sugar lactone lactonase YvrE
MLGDIEPIHERPGELLEGPRVATDGAVLFSDVTGGGVYRDGEPLVPKRRAVGGLVEHRDGGVVITGRTLMHDQRELLDLADHGVSGFNDLTTTPEGDVLVGALRFRPMQGEQPVPGLVVRVTGPGEYTVLDDSSVLWPNGVGVSPAADRIYMSDYAQRQVVAMAPDGSGAEAFCTSPQGSADGLAVDVEGGVWVALGEGGGVARFTPGGELDTIVDVPADFVTSLSFSGTDVLITTVGTVFRARSEVAGLPVALAAI